MQHSQVSNIPSRPSISILIGGDGNVKIPMWLEYFTSYLTTHLSNPSRCNQALLQETSFVSHFQISHLAVKLLPVMYSLSLLLCIYHSITHLPPLLLSSALVSLQHHHIQFLFHFVCFSSINLGKIGGWVLGIYHDIYFVPSFSSIWLLKCLCSIWQCTLWFWNNARFFFYVACLVYL